MISNNTRQNDKYVITTEIDAQLIIFLSLLSYIECWMPIEHVQTCSKWDIIDM